jgi:hypothetical protein
MAYLLEKGQSNHNFKGGKLEHRGVMGKVLLEEHVHLKDRGDRNNERDGHNNAQVNVGELARVALLTEDASSLGDVSCNGNTNGKDWHLKNHDPAGLEPFHSIISLGREKDIALVAVGRYIIAEEQKEGSESETFKDVKPWLDVDLGSGETDRKE